MNKTAGEPITLLPIGQVHSERDELSDEGWGEIISEIVMYPPFKEGLTGIEQFSHAIVLFWMDRAKFEQERHILRRPQGRDDMPELGIFAQRAKDRPNPIGVTTVRIVEVLPGRMLVRGLDAINGTQVLDIKPYYGCFDTGETAREPEWVKRLMTAYF